MYAVQGETTVFRFNFFCLIALVIVSDCLHMTPIYVECIIILNRAQVFCVKILDILCTAIANSTHRFYQFCKHFWR